MYTKLLSIVIPVYNVEKYIAKCLNSIYDQNANEALFEVIVVNDGSPDHSLDIIEQFKEKHQNLIIHTRENGGLSSARNCGIKLATGKYIWFVDSDDWLTVEALNVAFKAISKGYDVIATTLIYSYDDENKNYTERSITTDKEVMPSDYILNFSLGASQRYIIKSEYLKEHNLYFYPGIYHEDGEFGPRLIAPCKKVYMLSTPIYHYYQRESGSIMSSWKLKNSQDAAFIAIKTLGYSKVINDKRIRDSLVYTAFSTIMFAFGNNCTADNEIKSLYKKYRVLIRKIAFKALFAKGINFNKRILALASIVSPQLYYKLKR